MALWRDKAYLILTFTSLYFLQDEIVLTFPKIIAIQIKYNPCSYSYSCSVAIDCKRKREREGEGDFLQQYRHCIRVELRLVTYFIRLLDPAGNSDYWSAGGTDMSCLAVLYSEIIPVREHFIWWTALLSGQLCVCVPNLPIL